MVWAVMPSKVNILEFGITENFCSILRLAMSGAMAIGVSFVEVKTSAFSSVFNGNESYTSSMAVILLILDTKNKSTINVQIPPKILPTLPNLPLVTGTACFLVFGAKRARAFSTPWPKPKTKAAKRQATNAPHKLYHKMEDKFLLGKAAYKKPPSNTSSPMVKKIKLFVCLPLFSSPTRIFTSRMPMPNKAVTKIKSTIILIPLSSLHIPHYPPFKGIYISLGTDFFPLSRLLY